MTNRRRVCLRGITVAEWLLPSLLMAVTLFLLIAHRQQKIVATANAAERVIVPSGR